MAHGLHGPLACDAGSFIGSLLGSFRSGTASSSSSGSGSGGNGGGQSFGHEGYPPLPQDRHKFGGASGTPARFAPMLTQNALGTVFEGDSTFSMEVGRSSPSTTSQVRERSPLEPTAPAQPQSAAAPAAAAHPATAPLAQSAEDGSDAAAAVASSTYASARSLQPPSSSSTQGSDIARRRSIVSEGELEAAGRPRLLDAIWRGLRAGEEPGSSGRQGGVQPGCASAATSGAASPAKRISAGAPVAGGDTASQAGSAAQQQAAPASAMVAQQGGDSASMASSEAAAGGAALNASQALPPPPPPGNNPVANCPASPGAAARGAATSGEQSGTVPGRSAQRSETVSISLPGFPGSNK